VRTSEHQGGVHKNRGLKPKPSSVAGIYSFRLPFDGAPHFKFLNPVGGCFVGPLGDAANAVGAVAVPGATGAVAELLDSIAASMPPTITTPKKHASNMTGMLENRCPHFGHVSGGQSEDFKGYESAMGEIQG